jgi:hypothetical protein
MMFCLGTTVGRRIGNPCKMLHLAAKSADSMLLNLPHYKLPLRIMLGLQNKFRTQKLSFNFSNTAKWEPLLLPQGFLLLGASRLYPRAVYFCNHNVILNVSNVLLLFIVIDRS